MLLLLLLFLATRPLNAQDSIPDSPPAGVLSKRQSVHLNGYLKNLSTIFIPSLAGQWRLDHLIHQRVNAKAYIGPSLTLSLELRNRLFFGQGMQQNPDFAEQFTRSLDYLSLDARLASGPSYLLHSAIDRANLSWSCQNWNVVLGKQRINWSKSYVWNPNDVFNAYSFFDFDYEERRGADALLVRYQTGLRSSLELAGNLEQNFSQTVVAARYQFHISAYDVQFIGGKSFGDIIAGMGWAGQIGGMGFKGEITWFHPWENTSSDRSTWVADISFDYTMANANNLQFRLEGIFNSRPLSLSATPDLAFLTQPVFAKTLIFNQFGIFTGLSYDLSPLIQTSINAIWYLDESSYFLNPSLSFSLNANTEWLVSAQLFDGGMGSLFANAGNYVFTRLKWNF